MKHSFIKLLLSTLFVLGLLTTYQPTEASAALVEPPSYAKWGRIAMQKAQEKYPNADIVDYLHVGRKTGLSNSTEVFKLWLKAPNKEFGVYIDITFHNKTEQIVDIKYREVSK